MINYYKYTAHLYNEKGLVGEGIATDIVVDGSVNPIVKIGDVYYKAYDFDYGEEYDHIALFVLEDTPLTLDEIKVLYPDFN